MNTRLRRGFTVVELLIVIVVIVILALVTAVVYTSVQSQARDTQLKDAALKVGDGLELFYTKYGHFPVGGSGSSSALAGVECANGANGFIGKGAYTCTVEDVLVANKYLPANFTANLPGNDTYSPTSANYAIMTAIIAGSPARIMVFYSMDNQTAEDLTNFNAELVKCGFTVGGFIAQRDTYGMKNGQCVTP